MNCKLLVTTLVAPLFSVIGVSCLSNDGGETFMGARSSGASGDGSGGGPSGVVAGQGGSSTVNIGGASGNASAGSANASAGSAGGESEGGSPMKDASVDITPIDLIAEIAGKPNATGESFKNSFMLFPCFAQSGQDCTTIPSGQTCVNQSNGNLPYEDRGLIIKQTFSIGGTVGQMYKVTINVNGIAEAKYYENGKRAAGDANPPNPDAIGGTDTFYTGGRPVDYEGYNVYKLTVKDKDGKEPAGGGHYYLNSFPKTNTPYENHRTFPIAFTHDIPVVGGGTVELHAADSNCRAIDNCGPDFRTTPCNVQDGRKVPNETDLTIPSQYMGKNITEFNLRNGASQPFHSQLIHVRVTKVEPM